MAKSNKGLKKAATPSAAPMQQASTLNLPEGYKVKRQITVPTLVMKDGGAARLLKFNDAMRVSNYKDPDPKKVKEKPATVVGVTDMESGEVFQFLVPSVVEANLKRDYEGDAYVGLTFRIQCLGKRPNKRYRDFSIFEVESA